MKAKSPNSIDVYVGNRVRVRRKTLGMTQNGLAELLGITFQQIQKYEKGTNRIGASRLQRISEILRVPVGFFFENGGSGPIDGQTNELNSFLSSKEGLALNKAFIAIEDPNS
ncbi:helix-turn-helix domain-containing protein, partial [Rhizobium ruizarguesonis]